jgi:hypothetical protein
MKDDSDHSKEFNEFLQMANSIGLITNNSVILA